MNRLQALAVPLSACGVSLLACGNLEQAPIDAHLRITRRLQAERMDRMCKDWPGLGVDALGHVPGLPMLTAGDLALTTPPSAEQLATVGMSKDSYQTWATDMVVIDIDLVRNHHGGTAFLMHTEPVDAGTMEVSFHCSTSLPEGAQQVERADAHTGENTGHWCAPMDDAGWWICREVL